MRSFICAVLMVAASGIVLGAFAQDEATTRSGFAVVTLVSGNIAGLVATQNLNSVTGSGAEQVVVAPSPLLTAASLLVSVGSPSDTSTAIAIANPSLGAGGVNLVLTDEAGRVLMNRVVAIGPRGHFSRFLEELLAVRPASSTPLLLTVSSEIPVAIVGLNFRGAGDFASIPLTSLSFPTPVPVQPLTAQPTTSVADPGFGLGLPPVPPPVPTFVPATTATLIPTTQGTLVPTIPGTLIPVTPGALVPTTPGTLTPATSSPFTTGTATFSASPTTSFGGSDSLVFAQVATGGGWSTDIAIGNTSSAPQTIRIDFFGSNGESTGSLTEIVIPPRGVFFFSTDPSVATR